MKKCLEKKCPYANECYEIGLSGNCDCYIKNEATWIAEEIGNRLFDEYYAIHDWDFKPFLKSFEIIKQLARDYLFCSEFDINGYNLLNTYPAISHDKLKTAFNESIVAFEKVR